MIVLKIKYIYDKIKSILSATVLAINPIDSILDR